MGRLFGLICRNNFCRKFSLRVHKFAFQWDLCLHLSICILSLAIPFLYTGDRRFGVIPIVIWMLYHVWFILLLPRQGSSVSVGSNAPLPNTNNPLLNGDGIFARMYNNLYNRWNRNLYGNNSNLSSASSQQYHSTLKSTIEDFFSPKLLPILSVSYLLVALSLAVTGHRLGGPPLCYSSCDVCLSQWQYSIPLALEGQAASLDAIPAKDANGYDVYTEPFRHGCGYANGKELLAYYTMANTSFLLFFTVVVAMAVCLAWKVAEEEKLDRLQAEEWLRTESAEGFDMRARLIKLYGSPASPIRPEGSFTWVSFGVIAAITFTLLGWHNWYVLPPSHTATLLIILNLFTIIASMLILHLGFFGRILALYKRNLSRVEFLTQLLNQCTEQDLDSWWNCRNFVLNDDLSLDYDIGGLAVSATFLINVFVFLILMSQVREEQPQPLRSSCANTRMCIYRFSKKAMEDIWRCWNHQAVTVPMVVCTLLVVSSRFLH